MPTPAPRPPLMTAEERFEIAKALAKARAHCQIARAYLAVWNEKKEAR